jgi:dolichyl-phosphate-mannose--protein O-mannosyl transferase
MIFGLGIACKFHTLSPLTVCLFWGLYLSWKERSFSKGLFVFSCLLFIPLLIYLLTFVPWFARGYGLVEWLSMQKVIFFEMVTHEGTFMGKVGVADTEAWQWFLKPTGYVNFANYGGNKFILLAFSNPFVWLMVLPSTALLIWGIFRKRFNGSTPNDILFILLLFLTSYLPLVFSPRPLWLLSSLATIPFAFMIISVVAWRLSETIKWGKKLLWIYIIVVFLSSMALYPMACGKEKNKIPPYLNGIVEKYMLPFEKPEILIRSL